MQLVCSQKELPQALLTRAHLCHVAWWLLAAPGWLIFITRCSTSLLLHTTVLSSVPPISGELVTVSGATHCRRSLRTCQEKARDKSILFCNSLLMISNHVRGCYQQAQMPDICSTSSKAPLSLRKLAGGTTDTIPSLLGPHSRAASPSAGRMLQQGNKDSASHCRAGSEQENVQDEWLCWGTGFGFNLPLNKKKLCIWFNYILVELLEMRNIRVCLTFRLLDEHWVNNTCLA